MIPNSHQVYKLLPFGRIDQDSRPELVSPSDYIDAFNLQMGPPDSRQNGKQRVVGGNSRIGVQVDGNPLDRVRGAFHDRARNFLYLWVEYATAANRILRYVVDENVIKVVHESESLVFPEGSRVNTSVIIGGRHLCWATSAPDATDFIGDAPRWIDLHAGDDVDKEYEIYAWADDLVGSYFFEVYDPGSDGFVTGTGRVFDEEDTEEDFLLDLREYFHSNVNATSATRVVTDSGQLVFKVTVKNGNRLRIREGSSQGFVVVPCNDYLEPIADRATDLVRWPPRFAPVPTYRADDAYNYDYVSDRGFQFRVRYEYWDGSISAWGPISKVSSPVDDTGFVPDGMNSIRVFINDDGFNDTPLRSIVKRFSVAFREGNDGVFRLITTDSVSSLRRDSQYIDFYNDKTYPVVGSDASGAAADTQALKLFDFVPRGAVSMTDIIDEDGNAILALGGLLEGGDIADTSIKYTISDSPPEGGVGEEPSLCNVTIRGRIDMAYTDFQANYQLAQGYPSRRRFRSVVHNLEGGASGFVVYLAGTDLYGISDNFQLDPTGVFEIRNVPKGKFMLRVASPNCRFDDTQGERFNITRGREYQTTSAPVVDCAGGANFFEREIDLTNFNGSVFDLDSELGYGEIIIQSMASEDGENEVRFAELYLRDNSPKIEEYEGFESDIPAEDYISALSVPGKIVRLLWVTENRTDPRIPDQSYEVDTNLSDHNGYCYCIFENPFFFYDSGQRFLQVGAGQMSLNNPCDGNNLEDYRFYWATPDSSSSQNAWVSLDNGFVFFVDGSALSLYTFPVNSIIVGMVGDKDFRSKYSKEIVGNIAGSEGPVENIPVVMSHEGRIGYTDNQGDYSIITFMLHDSFGFSASNPQPRRSLTPNNTRDRCYELPFGPGQVTNMSLDFCNVAELRFDFIHDFDSSSVGGGGTGAPAGVATLFGKSGGRYQTAIVYEDRANRKGEVRQGPEIYIPFHTEDGLGYIQRYVNFEIVGQPPVWATHYRLLRTRNGIQARYRQRIVAESRYVEFPDLNSAPANRAYGAASITHLMLRLDSVVIPESDTTDRGFFFQATDQNTVSAQVGDRVRLILDGGQNTVVNDTILETEVVGEYVDPDNPENYYLILDAEPIEDIEVGSGYLIEVYTPRSTRQEDDFFFETGDAFPILNAGTESRRHGANVADQSADASMPAKGFLTGGDTFWRRFVQAVNDGTAFYSYVTENENASDFNGAYKIENIGRPNPLVGLPERFYYWKIRTSNTFLQNGSIVGINAFRSQDQQNVDQTFGPITKLVMAGQRMVVVCRHKVQPIYVAHEAVMDMSGNQLIGRTDRLLNIGPETVSPLGSQHPHSIVLGSSGVFGFDVERGMPWRMGQNGVQPIGKGQTSLFHAQKNNANYHFPACYDYTFGEYLISLGGVVKAFRGDREGWTSSYGFDPELMVGAARDFYTFNKGVAYVQNDSSSDTFYENSIFAYIELVTACEQVDLDKFFHNVRLAASAGDVSINPILVTQATLDGSPAVLSSRLLNPRFKRRGSTVSAAFLRDMNDARFDDPQQALFKGSKLTGQYIELKVNLTRIAMLELEWTPLMDSNS